MWTILSHLYLRNLWFGHLRLKLEQQKFIAVSSSCKVRVCGWQDILYGLYVQLDSGGGSGHSCPQLDWLRRWQPQIQWACYKKFKVVWKAQTKSGMGSWDWHVSMVNIHLWKLLWKCCPGQDAAKGNDWADRLAGKATITSGLHLRSEVLRSLRHYLRVQSWGHHTTDQPEDRDVDRGSAWWSSLTGRERESYDQLDKHWNCLKGNTWETC